jgi:5-formaminoimidazole-4-carboxamide-1-(beta)-D-ribofuranosyl 5'-monophosphate synthetase
VKVNEAARGYERAFFTVADFAEYKAKTADLLERKVVTKEALEKAIIEEFIIGAHVNFNYFYSSFAGEVELMGTDTRRQTNLDGFLRLPAVTQLELSQSGFQPKMVETGHYAVTVKESILEKIYDLGEKFVATAKKEFAPGIIGPFALQGAVTAEDGKEDIVIFDVSMRIPGSPGTRFTPYTGYLYGENISVGERIAMEIAEGVKQGKLGELLT